MSRDWRFLHVLLEGSTEGLLYDSLFRRHWEEQGWIVSSSVVVTSRVGSNPAFRGGVSRWSNLEKELRSPLRSKHFSVITTIIDYYGMPPDTPGMPDRPLGSPRLRVEHVEEAMARHCRDDRFVPHLTLHEFETWVFASSEHLAALIGDASLGQKLQFEVRKAGGPESINDGRESAPSKRLLRHCPNYSKTIHGPDAVTALGLPALREQCPHLDGWLTEIDRRAAR